MSHHSRRPSHSVSRRSHVIINRPVYYRYEEPLCFCGEVPCQCLPDTGALERSNPLPVGTYSVDLRNDQVPEFRRWQQGRSSVKVLKTNDNGEFSWILFSVSAPTVWAQGLGFPEIAKPTDERPQAFEPTKDITDQIIDALPSTAASVSTLYLVGFVGVGLTLYLYRKELFENVKRKLPKRRSARSR